MSLDSPVAPNLSTPDLSKPTVQNRPQRSVATPVRRNWQRIAWLEPFWLAILAPAILLPGRFWELSLQPLFVVLLFAFWPLRRVAYRRWSAPTPLAWPIGILMAWTPLSLWIAIDHTAGWIAVGYLLLGVALYWAAINWPPVRRRPQWLILPLALIGLLLAIFGPQLMDASQGSQLVRLPALYARVGMLAALAGESMNGNVLAGGLVIIVPTMAALAVEPRWSARPWGPLLAGMLAVGGLLPLLLTQSRGALLATLMAIFVLFALRWPRALWMLPLLIAGAGYAFFRLGAGGVLDSLSSDTSLVGLSGRLEIWDRALQALRDFLWTGVGHGQFLPIVPELYPFFTMPTTIPHAHNLFLQIGIDMGLVGMLAYAAIVLISLIIAWQGLGRSQRNRLTVRDGGRRWRRQLLLWALGAGVIASLTGMLLHGLVDAVLWNTKLAFLPWLFFALATLVNNSHYVPHRGQRRSEIV